MEAHPLVVVAAIAVSSALVSAWWLWTHRYLGSYDPDEAGYIAYALRYQRSISFSEPTAWWTEFIHSPHAPLVPLLSVSTLILGPRDPRSALLIQPVLMVVTVVASAGIARRLGGAWWAIATGLVVAGMQTMVLASQSYWYGLGAAAFMALSVWALLSSNRGANRWIWGFGFGFGLMLMTRTMVMGFAPGLALGAVFLAGWDRRRTPRVIASLALAAVIAGPWWYINRKAIFSYLFDYGYGTKATEWGGGALTDRLSLRLSRVTDALTLPRPTQLILAGLVLAAAVAIFRRGRGPFPLTSVRREALAVAVVCVVGAAALLSTRNEGIWFELPLLVIAIPLVLALMARAHPGVRVAFCICLVGTALVTPIDLRISGTNHADYALADFDERFGPDHRSENRQAAAEWWAMDQAVTRELEQITDQTRRAAIYTTGNTFMFNSNTIMLAAELDTWDAEVGVIDSRVDAEGRQEQLTPLSPKWYEGRQLERVLVVIRQEGALFTPDREWEEVERQALASGWREVEAFSMPVGGEVAILRHEDALAGGP